VENTNLNITRFGGMSFNPGGMGVSLPPRRTVLAIAKKTVAETFKIEQRVKKEKIIASEKKKNITLKNISWLLQTR
jgi:hypothetical protein